MHSIVRPCRNQLAPNHNLLSAQIYWRLPAQSTRIYSFFRHTYTVTHSQHLQPLFLQNQSIVIASCNKRWPFTWEVNTHHVDWHVRANQLICFAQQYEEKGDIFIYSLGKKKKFLYEIKLFIFFYNYWSNVNFCSNWNIVIISCKKYTNPFTHGIMQTKQVCPQ